MLQSDRGVDYVVYISNDVVFIDYSMRIELLGSQYKYADIFLSREDRISSNVSLNVIIARNTEWTIEFLSRWLSRKNEGVYAEDVLQQLLLTYTSGVPIDTNQHADEGGYIYHRVAVLPPRVLGSIPPVWRTHRKSSQFLDLSHEHMVYRAVAFRRLHMKACERLSSINGEMIAAPQLIGVKLEWLELLLSELPLEQVFSVEKLLEWCKNRTKFEYDQLRFQEVIGVYNYMQELLQPIDSAYSDALFVGDMENGYAMRLESSQLEILLWCYVNLRTLALKHIDSDVSLTYDLVTEVEAILFRAISVAYEVIEFCLHDETRNTMRIQLLLEISRVILPKMRTVSIEDGLLTYYEFKTNALLMQQYQLAGNMEEYLKSIGTLIFNWNKLEADEYETITPAISKEASDVFTRSGNTLCSMGRRRDGLQLLSRAIRIIKKRIESVLFSSQDLSSFEIELAEVLAHSGICAYEALELNGDLDGEVTGLSEEMRAIRNICLEHLLKCTEIYSGQLNLDNSSEKLLRSVKMYISHLQGPTTKKSERSFMNSNRKETRFMRRRRVDLLGRD